MEINTQSINALRDAAENFAYACRSDVANYEQNLSQIENSGNEAVKAAERVFEEFKPMIDELEKKKEDHEYMLKGLDSLIEKAKYEIESRKKEAESCQRAAELFRAEEKRYYDSAGEARHNANYCKEGEDPSGYWAICDYCENMSKTMGERAAEQECRVEQLRREIDGFDVQLKDFYDKQYQTKQTLDELENAISNAQTRQNEAKYRLDELRKSVEAAIKAAQSALADSRQAAAAAEQYANRIAQRAEEANQIITAYWS
ncbi:MAG: hypothetical protein IJS08_02645 [Victivallales bacterium]|nr:hypothetical protein [Victivallales bacterium]